MSTVKPYASTSIYGPLVGRGNVESAVLQTISLWLVTYVAEYERQNFLPPRTLVTPNAPESIHGDIDVTRFSSELFPEIVVALQPFGEPERHEAGRYGIWYQVQVASIVQVEGDQDATRVLADAYGTALTGIMTQQGGLGYVSNTTGRYSPLLVDNATPFATRTRLWGMPGAVEFPAGADVRDIVRSTVTVRTFIGDIVSDFDGPRVPPADPYAVPSAFPLADVVEVDLIRGTPDTHGRVDADAVVIDATVVPEVTKHEVREVDRP